jgi:hypothetical protein
MLSKERDLRPRDGTLVAERIQAIRRRLGVSAASTSQPTASTSTRIVPSLTRSERRSVSIVLGETTQGSLDVTLPLDSFEERTLVVRRIAEQHGGHVDSLGSADFLAVFGGRDFATRAARAALGIRTALGDTRVAVVTGAAVVTDRLPVGEVVDRAALLLEHESAGDDSVRIDAATAGLLPARFELRSDTGLPPVRERKRSCQAVARADAVHDEREPNARGHRRRMPDEPVTRGVDHRSEGGQSHPCRADEARRARASRRGGGGAIRRSRRTVRLAASALA